MKRLFISIKEWSEKTFPDAVSTDHLRKLKQEVDEAINDPNDILEYSDCLIALLASVNRSGFTFDDLIKATHRKLKINKGRKWIKNLDGTHQHLKNT